MTEKSCLVPHDVAAQALINARLRRDRVHLSPDRLTGTHAEDRADL